MVQILRPPRIPHGLYFVHTDAHQGYAVWAGFGGRGTGGEVTTENTENTESAEEGIGPRQIAKGAEVNAEGDRGSFCLFPPLFSSAFFLTLCDLHHAFLRASVSPLRTP